MSQQYYYSTLTGQQLDAALEQVCQVGASVEAAARSAEAAAESARLAQDAAAGNLPIGGENLGGVKNGGNVVINADGTMDAPAGGGSNQPLTFTGAVSATYDGSQAVEVEIPQGGGGGEWRFFQKIEVAEEIQYFYITETPEGEPFICNDLLLKVKAMNRNGADLSSFKLCINPPMPSDPARNMIVAVQLNAFGNKTGDRYYVFSAEFGEFGVKSRTLDCYGANIFQTNNAHASASDVYRDGTTYSALRHEGINAILIFATNNFMVGDIIEIYVK